MKLLIYSDLHVEFSPFAPDRQALAAADVVILAGDIHQGSQAAAWARRTFPDHPVILVAGNHEFYQGDWERSLYEQREQALRHGVHFLENEALTIGGVQFLGATLWTDYEYFGPQFTLRAMEKARLTMTDYRAISGCTPEATIERHRQSRAWLEQALAGTPSDSSPVSRVVISHHYPHKESTAAEYRLDMTTAAFGSQLPESLLERVGLWVHGHTHSSAYYRVGPCRVVCNPRGYPVGWLASEYENPNFAPRFVMELCPDGRWARAEVGEDC